jgi:hypothetical protein
MHYMVLREKRAETSRGHRHIRLDHTMEASRDTWVMISRAALATREYDAGSAMDLSRAKIASPGI